MTRLSSLLCLLIIGCYNTSSMIDRLDGGTDLDRDSAMDPGSDGATDSAIDSGQDFSEDPGRDPTECDRDADGWESLDCGGLDCNDADPEIHPGANEICADGIDQDCDGLDGSEGIRGSVITLLDYYHFGPNLYTMLVWTGTRYAFVWRLFEGEGIFINWIDATGKGVSDDMRVREYQNAYAMAWSGSLFGTIWSHAELEDRFDLYYQTLDTSGMPVMDEVRITHNGSAAVDGSTYYGPALTWANDSFAVVWMDKRRGPYQLFFTRVDTNGEKLLEDAQITSGTPEADGGMKLAWTGSEVGVAWNTVTDGIPHPMLFFGRVDNEGHQLSDPVQVTDSSAFAAPVILWNGTEYAAFWLDVTPEELARLFFARFSPAGTEIDRVMLISDMVDRVKNFTAVWTGADHGILWSQGESTGADLYLQRMTPGGELYGSRIQIPTSISPGRLQLVWNGHEFGMTWSEKTPEGDDGRVKVYFARVGFCD